MVLGIGVKTLRNELRVPALVSCANEYRRNETPSSPLGELEAMLVAVS
jgi:hypothetical protein